MILLLVDDEDLFREATAEWLRGRGYTVYTADNGYAGYQAIRAHPDIQVLITDWSMPILKGDELIAEARRLGRTMPAILTSGDDRAKWVAEKLGVQFLEKPCENETLEQMIKLVTDV